MFQKIKKLFTKTQKIEAKNLLAGKVIQFTDSYGQKSEISVDIDGNSNVLVIREIKNNYKLAFDKETSLLLLYILNAYYKTGNLNDLVNLFEKSEEN